MWIMAVLFLEFKRRARQPPGAWAKL